MHPKVYLLTELRRLLHYYNTRYTYTGQNGITINRGQVLPALQFKFDTDNYYVETKHLPVSDFDPFCFKCTYSTSASVSLIDLFKKLNAHNFIDHGIFESVKQFERSRHAKYYNQPAGVTGPAGDRKSIRATA